MKKTLAVVSAASIVLMSACGGGGRPSVDEIADGLRTMSDNLGAFPDEIELSDEFYTCWAEAVEGDEDISDDTAQAVADGEPEAEAPQDEINKVGAAAMECTDHIDL